MNNRRNLGLFIIIIGVVLLVFVIYYFFFRGNTQSLEPADKQGIASSSQLPSISIKGTTTPSDKPQDKIYDPSLEEEHQVNSQDLAKRAMLYSERLGSFSNQSNYSNLSDLKIYATPEMNDWIDKTISAYQAQNNQEKGYYGIQTKSLSSSVSSYDDKAGVAEIVVSTQRRESREEIGGGEPFIQKINISFRKINGEWLLDKAYWQDK
jgi:hypothetical protein